MTAPSNQITRIPLRDFPAEAQWMLARLRRGFPSAFGKVKPLKIGIYYDLRERLPRGHPDMLDFFRFYSLCPAYLQAQAQPGAMRYDLDGKAVEPVSDDNRLYAQARLNELAAEKQARRRQLAFLAGLLEPVLSLEDDGT